MHAANVYRNVPGAPAKAALDACLADFARPRPGVLALVLEVAGHAYAKAGSVVHIGAGGERCGWISPGCLEGALLEAAAASGQDLRSRLLELDNLDLADVFAGSGAGCRGHQRILLLPLAELPALQPILARYRHAGDPLALAVTLPGTLSATCGDLHGEWPLALADAAAGAPAQSWRLRLAPLPRLLACGAGPESELLLPLLAQLGWRVELVESRPAWLHCGQWVERQLAALPGAGEDRGHDGVLLMAHQFDRDRAALEALAEWPRLPAYIGLLGPETRRDDLLATLPPAVRARLHGRLESPAGMALGGRGPAAIALSLAARLQALACALDGEQGHAAAAVAESRPHPSHEPPAC
ncbi:MAG: XdhC family protein [Thermomonas sp.]|nr:XdhC family protein [Thermomonas sp.]